MRFEKASNLITLALAMQGTAEGFSLADIQQMFQISRRTAERMRDALESLFPQMERCNPGERGKRWRIPAGTLNRLVGVHEEELTELNNAIRMMHRDGLSRQGAVLEGLALKLQAVQDARTMHRMAPDLEVLLEAEGLAMRPGPRPRIGVEVISNLRMAIKACAKVRLHYRARHTGKLSRQIVCPYGLLYGNRHYLIAYSMNPQIRDYRLYSLANIEKVDVTRWFYERRDGFSLRDYAARSFGVFQEQPFDVVWKFSPEAAADARDFLFHPTQAMEDRPDGSLIVKFRAGGALEMCWHLFPWGDRVEIIEPEKLRKQFKGMKS